MKKDHKIKIPQIKLKRLKIHNLRNEYYFIYQIFIFSLIDLYLFNIIKYMFNKKNKKLINIFI